MGIGTYLFVSGFILLFGGMLYGYIGAKRNKEEMKTTAKRIMIGGVALLVAFVINAIYILMGA